MDYSHTTTTRSADHTYIFMEYQGVWHKLASATSIGMPRSYQTTEIDVTHLGSPGRSREYIGGRSPGNTVDVTLQYTPYDDTSDRIYKARGDQLKFRIVYPNSQDTGDMDEFEAILLNWDGGAATVDGVFEGTLTLRITGEIEAVAYEDMQ